MTRAPNEEERVEIVEHDLSYRNIFHHYQDWLESALEVKAELVGSQAVPMLGKKEIDIMLVCDDVERTHQQLRIELEHPIGPIQNGIGYGRDYRHGIEVEFHILDRKDSRVEQYRSKVRELQQDSEKRQALEEFKRTCNGMTRDEYRKVKSAFLKRYQVKRQ